MSKTVTEHEWVRRIEVLVAHVCLANRRVGVRQLTIPSERQRTLPLPV